MEKINIDKVFKKLDIQEADIISMSETWGFDYPEIDNKRQMVRRKYKTYEVTLKDGTKFHLKMNALTKELRSREEVGYDLMV